MNEERLLTIASMMDHVDPVKFDMSAPWRGKDGRICPIGCAMENDQIRADGLLPDKRGGNRPSYDGSAGYSAISAFLDIPPDDVLFLFGHPDGMMPTDHYAYHHIVKSGNSILPSDVARAIRMYVWERTGGVIEYTVEGKWPFPLDMMRYDCSVGATAEDLETIVRLSSEHPDKSDLDGKFRVKLVMTTGRFRPGWSRWKSFGWKVIDCSDKTWLDSVSYYERAAAEEKRKTELRESALAKLSPDEIQALGL